MNKNYSYDILFSIFKLESQTNFKPRFSKTQGL